MKYNTICILLLLITMVANGSKEEEQIELAREVSETISEMIDTEGRNVESDAKMLHMNRESDSRMVRMTESLYKCFWKYRPNLCITYSDIFLRVFNYLFPICFSFPVVSFFMLILNFMYYDKTGLKFQIALAILNVGIFISEGFYYAQFIDFPGEVISSIDLVDKSGLAGFTAFTLILDSKKLFQDEQTGMTHRVVHNVMIGMNYIFSVLSALTSNLFFLALWILSLLQSRTTEIKPAVLIAQFIALIVGITESSFDNHDPIAFSHWFGTDPIVLSHLFGTKEKFILTALVMPLLNIMVIAPKATQVVKNCVHWWKSRSKKVDGGLYVELME